MNKEEMKRRLEENVEPKYNKQRNLEEIKSNLTFTNEKEIMESMVQEKQQQTQKYRRMTLFFVLLGCFLLIGTNWMTYFTASKNKTILFFEKKEQIVEEFFTKNNYNEYSLFPRFTLYIINKYEFSIYQGEKENQIGYVYFVENLNEENNNPLSIKIVDDNNQIMMINKAASKEYIVGEMTIEGLTQGSQLTIDIYENDNFLEQRIITL